jgi:hypothetical protein
VGTNETEKIVGEFEEMSTTKLDDYYYVLTRLGFSIDCCLLTFRDLHYPLMMLSMLPSGSLNQATFMLPPT